MKKDDLGDRMKDYEALYSNKLLPYAPIYIRLDGRSFSKFTKGFDKPFDYRLWRIMNDITKYLVHQTRAKIGYHQSDEISLILLQDDYTQDIFFDGKIQKLTSVLASMAASYLQFGLMGHFDDMIASKASMIPHFDCRVCSLPNKVEATNMILWRALDAHRNAIQGLGQANFSHKKLQGMSCSKIVDALKDEKGIDAYNCEYGNHFLYGTFVKKINGLYMSTTINQPMNKMTNRSDFIFNNLVEPEYELVSNEGLCSASGNVTL